MLDLSVVVTPATTPEDVAGLSARLPVGFEVTLVNGVRSWAGLTEARDRVLASASEDNVAITWAYPDARRGRVVVGVLNASDQASIRDAVGTVVETVVDQGLVTVACPSRSQCDNPWRGGTRILSQSGPGPYECTWGFIGRPTTTSGTRYVISAGHCNFFGGE